MNSACDNSFGKRTGHFISHWGVPNEIYCREAFGLDKLAIIEFRPKKNQLAWRYATNGMSEYVQCSQGPTQVRTELYCTSNNQCPWAIDLLTALATYPIKHHTFLAEFDTLDIGQPSDRRTSPFTGIILTPPEEPTLGAFNLDKVIVLIHRVVFLYENEIDYAIMHSGAALYSSLIRSGINFHIDQWRHCTCPGDFDDSGK